MVILPKPRKSTPTDLSWEEQLPFSYRFHGKVVTELQRAVTRAKENGSKVRHAQKTITGRKVK